MFSFSGGFSPRSLSYGNDDDDDDDDDDDEDDGLKG